MSPDPNFPLKPGFFFLLILGARRLGSSSLEHSGRRLQHLSLPLRHLHRMQVVVRCDLLHRLDSPDRLQRYPRLELRTVVPSLLFHVSVGLGYTPETS